MKIRTRIAPSPTGYMHIGTLRTLLFNYFVAKQNNGSFIVRIEDTDRERLVDGAVADLLNVMNKIGIQNDEGPVLNKNGEIDQIGDFGPYIQSERLEIYRKYIDELVSQGDAYHCFCSKERLDKMRDEQRSTKQTPKYDRKCCSLTESEIQDKINAKESFVIRLKIPEGETTFTDVIRGKITIPNLEIDDQVILKSDGFPTYHLAVVVDDHLMEISHVVRGEEWISSTPKHVILYNLLNWKAPLFAHSPNLLNTDKTKLSKRQGDVAVEDYLKRGYLPKAIINFIGTLGFNPSGEKELYTIDELIESFDLSKVNKAGAILNIEKLDWMNNHYIKELTMEELKELARPFVQADVDHKNTARALFVERERVHRLEELDEKIKSYLLQPSYDPSVLVWKKSNKKSALLELQNVKDFIENMDDSWFDNIELIEKKIKQYITDNNLKTGEVLWPLRVALSGQERSSSPFEYVWVLKKEESVQRLDYALKLLV